MVPVLFWIGSLKRIWSAELMAWPSADFSTIGMRQGFRRTVCEPIGV